EWIGTDNERARTLMPHYSEGGIDLARCASLENQQLQAECARGFFCVVYRARRFWKIRVRQQSNNGSMGNKLMQKPQSLAAEHGIEPADPGNVAAWPV